MRDPVSSDKDGSPKAKHPAPEAKKKSALGEANASAKARDSGAKEGSPSAECQLGSIEVTPKSAEGDLKPPKDIRIQLTGPTGRTKDVKVDEKTLFKDLKQGDYTITGRHDGWELVEPKKIKLPPNGKEKAEIELKKIWLVKVIGKLFWNRTWDYNDETTPIAAVKEYLPGAKVRLLRRKKGESDWTTHATTHLSDGEDEALRATHRNTGEFVFKDVPEKESDELTLAIFLEYKGGKIVSVKGRRYKGIDKIVDKPDYAVKAGETVWHTMKLDPSKVFVKKEQVDLGDLEIKKYPGSEVATINTAKTDFVHLCDAYKTVWVGYKRVLELTEHKLPICQINYPEDESKTVSNASAQMQACKLDLLDRDVLLHEYGHFIGHNVLGGLTFFGYTYVDNDPPSIGQHSQNSKEHYEDAWVEGHATFLSCALMNDEHYHDGYDTNYNSHLAATNILIGPHCEGSIQQALWRIYKHHGTNFKDGFWKAFTDSSKRKCETIFDFYLNWKELGLANLGDVVESLKKLNMEYGYDYTDRYSCIAQKTILGINVNSYSATDKEFARLTELHSNLGRAGKGAEYGEEFFNRNNQLNKGAMPGTSKYDAPTVTVGKSYIAPKSFKVST